MMTARLLLAVGLLAILSSFSLAGEPVVESAETWSGKIPNEELRKLAPDAGFITDAQAWAQLWKAWRPPSEVPKVDFNKELILVGTVPGPNLVIMQPTIDDNGDVRFLLGSTRVGGPGFGYKLIKIDREGVQTVNGTAVNAASEESITVIVVGTLRNGEFAIGGETTGTTITADAVTWELDLSRSPEFRTAAEKLDGQMVVVQGRLERRMGVEIKERWIVHVTSLEASE